MGKFSLAGILLVVGLFLTMFGFLLAQVDITNPYTGQDSSIFAIIIGWIIP